MSTEIDFTEIRNSLKEFLRSQDELQDYDFDGSAISSIIDLLAYTTHINAVNANVGLNETFLDTAQFRGSVVGHARQLGYIPRSATAATASISVQVNNSTSNGEVEIQRGHPFRATINGETFTFFTLESYTSDVSGFFSNVIIAQGTFRSSEFIFDVRSGERFVIPDSDIDTSTLLVKVYDDEDKLSSRTFLRAREITEIQSDSNVYFVSENPDGLYEIHFGDGVLGQALSDGNLIRAEYLVTRKESANGASTFSSLAPIGGTSNLTISTLSRARGGGEKESINSIRNNAPITFASQNRAVLPDDFDAIIRAGFSDIRSVKVWGGEDNDPPVYGKVFISVLPKSGNALSLSQKQFLLDEVINPKAVITTTPEIIDPEFLSITGQVFFKYDPSKTNLTESQLEAKVEESLIRFDQEELLGFDSVFRYSRFLKTIDDTDESILNSFARIFMSKQFIPILNTPTTYTLDYSVPLFKSFGTRPVINESSTFTVEGKTGCRFKDFLRPDGESRRISIVRGIGGDEEIVVRNAGSIEDSKIILTGFSPQAITGDSIVIEVIPSSYDIVGSFNNVVTFNCACVRFSVTGEVDTIVTGRDYSGSNYQTISRDE